MTDFEVVVESRPVHGSTAYFTLSDVATVSDVSYSTSWGEGKIGGCGPASFKVDLPTGGGPYWLVEHAIAALYYGPVKVWEGEITEITPGNGGPWEVHMDGLARAADGYMAADSTSAPTSIPRTAVVDQIGTFSLPWLLPDPTILSDAPFVGDATDLETIMHRLPTLLNAWAESDGKRLAVFSDRKLEVRTDPTTPTYLVRGAAPQVAVADENFVTHMHIRYVTALSGTPPEPSAFAYTSIGDASIPDTERVWEFLDLAPTKKLMIASQAEDYAQARLDLLAPRTGWANRIEVARGQLFSIDGTPSEPALLEAGTMVRVEGVYTPDQMLDFRGYADVIVQHTEFNTEAGTVTLTPMGMVPRDFESIMAVSLDPQKARFYTESALAAYARETEVAA